MQTLLPAPAFYCLREAPLASVAVLWGVHLGRPRIMRVAIYPPEVRNAGPAKTDLKDFRPAGCAEIDEIADLMEGFLKGADIRFPLDSILLELCSEFQQQVLRAEYGIPRGKVSTYQLIAAFLGKPSAARAVGNALATNPFPIIIPCHRAIRSDRTLGGFQGGLPLKRALLELEGISFDGAGRVAVEDFFYAPGPGR